MNKKNIALMIIASVSLAVALLVGALCAHWWFHFIIAFGGVYTTAWLVAICLVLIAVGGVAAPHTKMPSFQAELSALREHLNKAALRLSSKELQVIELLYGLEDGKEWKQQEIGDKLGVTHQRISQIQAKALTRLRCCPQGKVLGEYFD